MSLLNIYAVLKPLSLQLWEQYLLRLAGWGIAFPRDSSMQGRDLWGGFLGVMYQIDLPAGIASLALWNPVGSKLLRQHFLNPWWLMIPGTPFVCLAPCTPPCACPFACLPRCKCSMVSFLDPLGHRRGSRGQGLGVKWQFFGDFR